MGISSKLKTTFRGDIPFYYLPHEALRRLRASAMRRTERSTLDALNEHPARLLPEFAKLSSEELFDHFQSATSSCSWLWEGSGQNAIEIAEDIVNDSAWDLMGFGKLTFAGPARWRRDPLTSHDWGLEYHADVQLSRGDGTDVRVLWELNRLGHLLPLAAAYRASGDERFAETFFEHIYEWIEQNPYGRGANWSCAMEVALRAANVLAAFDVFRNSAALTAERLLPILRFVDQHGRFITDNSEFSYITTSNHYLSNVVGLFWIGTLVPELEHASEWRDHGLKEMLREMDKQVLPDGVDFEASTGYHKFVTEMFDASFRLAKQNGVEIDPRYWRTLDKMRGYLETITRPDGGMPLVGDFDGSRFLSGRANWPPAHAGGSDFFPDAGICVLRDDDLYLLFNASDCGVNGRGSHGHNDALSIEVSAFGRPFIVDPGSYAYNLDLDARHMFRSTAYHSTVTVDGEEQNTIERDLPFVIGNEASPKILEWTTGHQLDRVSGEHYGYRRLKDPVTHSRTVEFDKTEREWRMTDLLSAKADHVYQFRFHFDSGLDVRVTDDGVEACDNISGIKLLVSPEGGLDAAILEESFVSRDYGEKEPSITACWTLGGSNVEVRWRLIPRQQQ